MLIGLIIATVLVCLLFADEAKSPPVASRRVEDDLAPPEVPLDAEGRLDGECPCVGCGYDLQGLRPDGTCPECSAPIESSLKGDYLRFADRAWLRRLVLGVWLILGGIGGQVVAGLAGGILVMLAIGSDLQDLAIGFAVVAASAVAIVFVIGVWLLTTPEPARAEREGSWSARRIARLCVLAMLLSMPLEGAAAPSGGALMNPAQAMGGARMVMAYAAYVLEIAVVVSHVAGLFYLRQLAVRIPRARMVRHTTVVLWGLGIVLGLGLLVNVLALVMLPMILQAAGSGAGGPSGSFMVGMAVMSGSGCLVAVGALTFGIWGIILLFQYAFAFRRAIETASA